MAGPAAPRSDPSVVLTSSGPDGVPPRREFRTSPRTREASASSALVSGPAPGLRSPTAPRSCAAPGRPSHHRCDLASAGTALADSARNRNPDAIAEHCVVVGDTAADLQFAKNIGASSCFAAFGFGNTLVCTAIGYTHQIEKLSDLITLYPPNS